MTRADIINYFVIKYKMEKYLEIGVQNSWCINQIKCPFKDSVDPDKDTKANYHMTSDDFFKKNTNLYNLIFIDGLHEAEQVFRDIGNALNSLEDDGVVIIHDCLPPNEDSQKVPRETKIWVGDVWKAILRYRQSTDLEVRVVNTDYGVGIIRKGKQTVLEKITEDYNEFDKDRERLLNLISIKEFYQHY